MTLKKITKPQARKLWNQGIAIKILPSKANPFSPWYEGHYYGKRYCEEQDFDKFLLYFKYYNCNKEVGNGISFYINE